MIDQALPQARVLDSDVHALSWEQTLDVMNAWAADGRSGYVCLCNVHSVVTATSNAALQQALREADLVLPDGMPIAWTLRRRGFPQQQRIGGPDLMERALERASASGKRVYLYGSTPATLGSLSARLKARLPRLEIVGTLSPPFRTLTPAEDEAIVAEINAARPDYVFVALGCPRQEIWMHEHRSRILALMVGVGAAFDFHAGLLKRAPAWLQACGLEWLFRLCAEPRRLARRYFVTNTLFIWRSLRRT